MRRPNHAPQSNLVRRWSRSTIRRLTSIARARESRDRQTHLPGVLEMRARMGQRTPPRDRTGEGSCRVPHSLNFVSLCVVVGERVPPAVVVGECRTNPVTEAHCAALAYLGRAFPSISRFGSTASEVTMYVGMPAAIVRHVLSFVPLRDEMVRWKWGHISALWSTTHYANNRGCRRPRRRGRLHRREWA